MIEYIILRSSESDSLAKKVNELLAQGWQLRGGVSVGGSTYESEEYVQAMTRINWTAGEVENNK